MSTVNVQPNDGALGPYRALDLTEGGFNWCGKVLADLGADVIKVAPPRGSSTRSRRLICEDKPGPGESLFWHAYCLNKRSITLKLQSRDGREIFKRLAKTADFIIESFPPGYMKSLELGYEVLSRVNPGLIMTSITSFGPDGPHAMYKATDLTAMAMGGMVYLSGDEGRPPVRVSLPQAELHAGGQAAAGSMTAFWHRQRTGLGQHVNVSMQVSVVWTLMTASLYPKLHGINVERAGVYLKLGALPLRLVYPCKDGFMCLVLGGGGFGRSTATLVRWMAEENMAPAFMVEKDWASWDLAELESREEGVKELRDVEDYVAKFLLTKTKGELYHRALRDKILMAPCTTVKDVYHDLQLQSREFWLDVLQTAGGPLWRFLGPYVKLSESPGSFRRPAPDIGEHNEEVYMGELGLSSWELKRLRNLGVV